MCLIIYEPIIAHGLENLHAEDYEKDNFKLLFLCTIPYPSFS